jgi:hypothetical protein
MDMRCGTWNVKSLYRAGSIPTVTKELARYKLDLVGVQEAKWEGGGTEPAGEYLFFNRKGNENQELDTGFLVHKRIISADKRYEISIDNGVRLVNFTTSESSHSEVRGFHTARSINILGRLQRGKPTNKLTIFC